MIRKGARENSSTDLSLRRRNGNGVENIKKTNAKEVCKVQENGKTGYRNHSVDAPITGESQVFFNSYEWLFPWQTTGTISAAKGQP